jgi:beta-galactosidase
MTMARWTRPLLLTGAALLAIPCAAAPAPAPATTGHRIDMDGYSFKLDGKRVYVWSGEFHPYRLPSPDLWRDILQKMKAAGFNATSIYFSWGYHSPAQGVYDFTGVRDMDRLLDIAAEEGVYVIARPGPYINAEVDSGGFPLWLTRHAVRNRSDDPAYLALADEWMAKMDAVIARHQYSDGRGSVIAYQVENEYYRGDQPGARAYMEHLKTQATAHGVTVPFIGNHDANFVSGTGALKVDGWDYYPQRFDCSHPEVWNPVPDMAIKRVPDQPLITPEFQGGAFDPWGGPGYAKCAALLNDRFASVFYKQNIAAGATLQNFYMIYGGTSWGWQAIPQNYTSYDYGAAITEGRQFDAKYAEDKRIGYFTQAVAPLTMTVGARSAGLDNKAIVDVARRNPATDTQFHYLRHADSTVNAIDSVHLDLSVAGHRYKRVPQAADTAITLNGRQGKILLAGYALGPATLVYSTSELMTHASIAGREVAVVYGDAGQPGETVLRAATRPTVEVLDGTVAQDWSNGDLRLNYTHGGVARVRISGAGFARPLLLLIADKDAAATFWRRDTATGAVLVRGTHLLRGAALAGNTLDLSGDTGSDGSVEVFADTGTVRWNGVAIHGRTTPSGSIAATLPTARPVKLPALTWRMHDEAPEIAPGFDDSGWATADRTVTTSITKPEALPVLFADDYGFHTGNIWYRGHFQAGEATGVTLKVISGGKAGAVSAWLNGQFLGSVQGETLEKTFTFPAGAVKAGGDNVLSVLTVNMGHEEDYDDGSDNRTARGLTFAALNGGTGPITWRLQGVRGGETLADPVRGPLNNGGLFGERSGWSLPGFRDSTWQRVSLPASANKAGVTWYRSTTRLALPKGQDSSIALDITDDATRPYRATIFVNGWQMGNYVNQLGPQHRFPIPTGILNPNGTNTIAIAVWNTQAGGGLGRVSLVDLGSYRSSLRVAMVPSPGYAAAR